MPQIYHPEISLDHSSGTYYASYYGQNRVEFRPNSAQLATITIDNTNNQINLATVLPEDRVQLYVAEPDTPLTRYELLDGYIVSINREKDPGGRKLVTLGLVDYIGYYAAKKLYENNYWKSIAVQSVVTAAAGQIPGISTTGVGTISTTIRRDFAGTSVKDVFGYCGEFADAEWFGKEDLDLDFFTAGSRNLTIGGSTAIIRDDQTAIISSNNILPLLQTHPFSYKEDATERFRSVKVTNGIITTLPTLSSLNLMATESFKNDLYGKEFGVHISNFNQPGFDIRTGNLVQPFQKDPTGLTVGGLTIPAVKIPPVSTGDTMLIYIGTFRNDAEGTGIDLVPWGIPLDTYSEMRMFLRNSLATASVTDIIMTLLDFDTEGFWVYKIKHSGGQYYPPYDTQTISAYNDLITSGSPGGTGFAFLRYFIPTSTSDSLNWSLSPANWVKVAGPGGNPAKIDLITIEFTPDTGYSGTFDFAQVYFYGKTSNTQSAGGSPATQKIIVDRSLKDLTSITNRAEKELDIANVLAKRGQASIVGHTDFKRPGYNIQINFNSTLSVGTTAVRLDKITHQLTPTWVTTVEFNDPFQRL